MKKKKEKQHRSPTCHDRGAGRRGGLSRHRFFRFWRRIDVRRHFPTVTVRESQRFHSPVRLPLLSDVGFFLHVCFSFVGRTVATSTPRCPLHPRCAGARTPSVPCAWPPAGEMHPLPPGTQGGRCPCFPALMRRSPPHFPPPLNVSGSAQRTSRAKQRA